MTSGKMIWFNPDKGFGYIRTEEDERLYVGVDGFADGNAPQSRCKGLDVAFERAEGNDGPVAVDVHYITVPEIRRARLRRSR